MAPNSPAGTMLGRVAPSRAANRPPIPTVDHHGVLIRSDSTSRSYQEECAPTLPCAPLPDVITPTWPQAVLVPVFVLGLVAVGALLGVGAALALLGLGIVGGLVASARRRL